MKAIIMPFKAQKWFPVKTIPCKWNNCTQYANYRSQIETNPKKNNWLNKRIICNKSATGGWIMWSILLSSWTWWNLCTFIHLSLDFSIYSPVSSRSGNSTGASAICCYLFPSGAPSLNEVITIYRIFRNLIYHNKTQSTAAILHCSHVMQ